VTSDQVLYEAHAVGLRSDLPVDLWIVLTAGALAVVLSFVLLSSLWHTSKLRGDRAGAPVPSAVQAVLDSPVLRWALRLVTLALALFVVAVALLGSNQTAFNLSPYAFYVTFWVGLIPASLLLGPVWRAVNPLRTLHRLLVPLTGPAPAADQVDRLGLYPAAGFMLAYAWLELVYPDRAIPQTVAVVMVLYASVQLVAALWYGEGWFERGDAFEVWSTLLGRFSVLGRREDGRLVVRNPLDGADGTPQQRGLAAFVCVVLGSTAFDGVTRAQWYQSRVSLDTTKYLTPTWVMAVVILVILTAYVLGTVAALVIAEGRTGEGVPEQGWRRLVQAPELYAHSIVPIAAGYAVAHYFSLLLFEGQLTWILASNPFYQEGVDYFGTFRNEIDLNVVSASTISAVQVSAIILGHVLGVVLAHDRAVRLHKDPRTALLSQLPLLVMMVAFTCGGLALLLG
jgi:hypothetical protein